MHASHCRRGVTRIEVVTLAVVGVVALSGCLGMITGARETARGNACRSNMRAVGMAVYQFSNDYGIMPGYTNALLRTDDTLYVDPKTGKPAPVSWAVMILPYVDQRKQYDEWRNPAASAESLATPISLYQCLSDSSASNKDASLSFVANSGMPDLKSPADEGSAEAQLPRDRAANGMFFDSFTDNPQLQPNAELRRPRAKQSFFGIQDPAERTILLTENIDATSYVIDAANSGREEIALGCTWRGGPIDGSTKPPSMEPDAGALKINAKKGSGDGANYAYCRPSSYHPGGVNMTFAGQNTLFISEDISYYVYAKLMASDDANAGYPETPSETVLGPAFADYQLKDEDYVPVELRSR